MRVFDGRMAFVPEGQADRSQARMPGTSATQKSRPVGYGVIRAGVRTDSMIGVTKFTRLAIAKAAQLIGVVPTGRACGHFAKASSESLLRNVPEGWCDRSLARSAWDPRHPKEPSRRVRCDSCRCARRFDDWSDEISNTKTENIYVVCGISCARSYRTLRDGSFEGRFPRHFVPGYYHAVPPGQNTFDRRRSSQAAVCQREPRRRPPSSLATLWAAARNPSLETSKLHGPSGRRHRAKQIPEKS